MRHPLSLPAIEHLAQAMAASTGWLLVRLDEDDRPVTAKDAGPLEASVDLIVQGQRLGKLGLRRTRQDDGSLGRPPQELLRSLSELVTSWIHSLRLARDNDEELTSLIELTRLLTSTVDLSRILQISCEAAAAALEAESTLLFLLDGDGVHLEPRAQHGLADELLGVHPIKLAESPADLEALAGDPVLIEDVATDDRCRAWPAEVRRPGNKALCVGLIGRRQKLGTLHVFAGVNADFTIHLTRLLMAIAGQIAACIEQASLERESRQSKRLRSELAAGREIQAALLPRAVPQRKGFDLAVHFEPAREVGGDLYDFIELGDDDLGLAIGDATGKSITGALMMATVRGGLHAYVEDHYHIADIVRRLNVDVHNATYGEFFMTLFYGVLNLKTGVLTYTNAGHNPPLWIHNGQCAELRGGGTFLGADPECEYHVSTVALTAGDVVVFYTDGLSESRNPEGLMLGVNPIRDVVLENSRLPADQIVERLLERSRQFTQRDSFRDDVTLLVLRVNP
jgi:sigma-B regulation protein RsbU (phosphoserine phosphatase)